jgi:chromosome segregation ATPase
MAIAATAGCAAGATTAYVIDQRRAKYSNKETNMNTIIKDVQDDNEKLKKRSVDLRAVMQDNQKTLNDLNQQIRIKQIDQKTARTQLRVIAANQKLLDAELKELDDRNKQFQDVIEMRKAMGGQDVRQLQRQVDDLNAQKNALQELKDIAYSQFSSINASMGQS